MEILIQLFLPISIWFQAIPDWLSSIFQGITFLGNTEFYLLGMPLLFWCIDTTLGIRIGIMLLVGGSINNILKFCFQWPRPFWVSTQIEAIVEGTGFGFPSGHAQNASSIWGLLAASTRKNWIRWSALAAIFLIGFSRIVLGVHFTHDVLIGWLVGALLLLVFLKLEKRVTNWFKNNPMGIQILALVVITAFLLLPAILLVPPFDPPAVPTSWIEGAEEIITPYSYDGLLTTAGSFLGLGLGVILLYKTGMFTREGKAWQLVLRYLVGIIGVLVLYLGLGSIFPDDISFLSYFLRFLRYFLIGLWIAFGAPKLFSALKLTTIIPA
ncbi:MAG: phosphatase PAP2 family protein [Anaerolineales bacterium]|nr:phosphatase PAP2 family protein [Anaerolineales bacterium]